MKLRTYAGSEIAFSLRILPRWALGWIRHWISSWKEDRLTVCIKVQNLPSESAVLIAYGKLSIHTLQYLGRGGIEQLNAALYGKTNPLKHCNKFLRARGLQPAKPMTATDSLKIRNGGRMQPGWLLAKVHVTDFKKGWKFVG